MENNNVIMCIVDMFANSQEILYPDESSETISLSELATYLPATCYTHGIFKIHLFGNKKYLTGLADKILTQEKLTYSNNKLEIEVN